MVAFAAMRDTGPVAAHARSRLPREARREQLIAAATPIVAAQGFADFSLEELAGRANVTRNLLYHYFPRGRIDVVQATVEQAGRDLTDGWEVDESVPLPVRLAANLGRLIEHALAPSDAWRIYRVCRASADPEVTRTVSRYREIIIASIALNHLGTPDPPPLVHLALEGYIGFAETVLDEALSTDAPRDAVMRILEEALVSVVASAQSVAEGRRLTVFDTE
jgi:AcrR family transcriptional regulator